MAQPKGTWLVAVQIHELGIVRARVVNLDTGNTVLIEERLENYIAPHDLEENEENEDKILQEGWDQAIGECMTTLRDTIDKV